MGCERVSTVGGHQRVVLLASERITTAGVHQPFSLWGPAKAPTPASTEGASYPDGWVSGRVVTKRVLPFCSISSKRDVVIPNTALNVVWGILDEKLLVI